MYLGLRKIMIMFVRWFDAPMVRPTRSKVRSNSINSSDWAHLKLGENKPGHDGSIK